MLSNARMSTAGVRRDRDRHQGVSAEKILYIWNIQPYAVLSQAGTVHPEGRAKPELGEPRPTDAPPQGRRLQQKEPAAAQRADGRRGGLTHGVRGEYQPSRKYPSSEYRREGPDSHSRV